MLITPEFRAQIAPLRLRQPRSSFKPVVTETDSATPLAKPWPSEFIRAEDVFILDARCDLWYYICIVVMEVSVESAITVKGQATIPKAIREHLGLKPGDRIKFFVHPDGSVVLLPKLSASSLRGIIKSRRRRPVTIAEMTEAAVEGAARVARPTRRR